MISLIQKETKRNVDISERTKEETIHNIICNHGEEIKRLIFTYAKSYDVTEDIFQEFLIQTYKSLDGFKSNSSLKTWLYRIAINKCKDYLRSPIHRLIHYTDKFNAFRKQKSAESSYLENESKSELAEMVLSLPIKYREVIILRYYKDLSIREISTTLNVKESTIATRLMRGRNRLETKLGGVQDEFTR